MTARIFFTALLAGFGLPGCVLMRSDPVPSPPPPPPQIALARGDVPQTLEGLLERGTSAEVVAFKPLEAARSAVAKAAASPAVANYAPEPLRRGQGALDAAEEQWSAIAQAPLGDPQALALAAHAAHEARRWGEIALAQAAREVGLRDLAATHNALVEREQTDAQWQGKQLVPGDMGRLRFAIGTAELDAGSQAVVQRLAQFMADNPRYRLQIVGHTDVSPPSDANLEAFLQANPETAAATVTAAQRAAAYNLMMSKRRAQAVRDALINAGVAGGRLTTRGYGSQRPIADNDSAAGRRRNRRVEIMVVPAGAEESDSTLPE